MEHLYLVRYVLYGNRCELWQGAAEFRGSGDQSAFVADGLTENPFEWFLSL